MAILVRKEELNSFLRSVMSSFLLVFSCFNFDVVDSEERCGFVQVFWRFSSLPPDMNAVLAVLLCIAAVHTETPLLHLTKESERFVEKEVGKFRCSYNGTQGNVTLSMFLRDPELNGTLFTAPSHTSVGQASLRFDLAMRRDYAGKTLVCNSSDGGLAEMKVGAVRPTIPINVSFSIAEYLVYPLAVNIIEFCCEVETKIPAKVFIIGGLTNDKRLQKERRSDTIFCNPKPRPVPEFLHTGWPFACLAESSEGAVYSNFRRLFVFDPKFGASSRLVTLYLEPSVSVSITYNDMQAPLHPMRTFQVCKKTETGKCSLGKVRVLNVTVERLRHVTFRVKIKNLKRLKARFLQNVTLRANVTFVPEDVGKYQVLFVIELNNVFVRHKKLVRKGPQLVVWNHYAEISEERLLTPEVTLGAFGSLTFHLNASVPLQEEELLFLGPSGTPLSAEDLRILHNGTSLRIDFVVSDSTGNYQVAFHNIKANATGRQHGIQVKEPILKFPESPIKKRLSSSPVSVMFNYTGLQPPAFPMRVFKVFKVGESGNIISRNVTLLNVTMKRVDGVTFQTNVSFLPERTGQFQIFFTCGRREKRGPIITIRSFASDLILGILSASIVAAVFLVITCITLASYYCCLNKCMRGNNADTVPHEEIPMLPNDSNATDATAGRSSGNLVAATNQKPDHPIEEAFRFLADLKLEKTKNNPEDVQRTEWKPQEVMYPHGEPESPVSFHDYFGNIHFPNWNYFPKTIHYERKEDEDLQSKLSNTIFNMCSNMCGSTHCRVEVDFIKIFFTHTTGEWKCIKTLKDLEDKRKHCFKQVRFSSIRAFSRNGLIQALVDTLKDLGAQETGRNEDDDRKVRCVFFRESFQHKNKKFNNTLTLSPNDLSFEEWNCHRYYDQTLCLTNPVSHGTTTAVADEDDVASDIRIKAVSVALSGVDEYKKQWSELKLRPPDVLTKPGLNGLIRYKADGKGYQIANDSHIKEIQEKSRHHLNFKMGNINVALMTSKGEDLRVDPSTGYYHRQYSFDGWPKVLFSIEDESKLPETSELVTKCVIRFMKELEKRRFDFCPWRTYLRRSHRELTSIQIQSLRRITMGESLNDMLGVRGELDLSVRLQEVLNELEDLRSVDLPTNNIPYDPTSLSIKLKTAAERENVSLNAVC